MAGAAVPTALDMRRAIGRFGTGVAVVTAGDVHAGVVDGMTVNSLTSVSLNPPILLVSLTLGARTTEAVVERGRFGVSLLGDRQESVARHFASRGAERGLDPDLLGGGAAGLPLVRGALASFSCSVARVVDVADHRVVFGDVEAMTTNEGSGLMFFAGSFGAFRDFGHEPLPWWY